MYNKVFCTLTRNLKANSVHLYCCPSFLWRPPFIKVNEKLCFQLNTFITSTTTPTARMMCLILVEPSVNFYPSSQKFKTHGGLFPPSELSLRATATQIFTLHHVSLIGLKTRLKTHAYLCLWAQVVHPAWLCV